MLIIQSLFWIPEQEELFKRSLFNTVPRYNHKVDIFGWHLQKVQYYNELWVNISAWSAPKEGSQSLLSDLRTRKSGGEASGCNTPALPHDGARLAVRLTAGKVRVSLSRGRTCTQVRGTSVRCSSDFRLSVEFLQGGLSRKWRIYLILTGNSLTECWSWYGIIFGGCCA